MRCRAPIIGLALGGTAVVVASAFAAAPARWFADRPIAWQEHDDGPVPALPEPNDIQDLETTLTIRDGMANEVDRILALEGPLPAQDVNALDEVACSTWFCPRNHRAPLSVDETIAGPPAAVAPRPPFRITKGKDQGASLGFQVADAAGKKFMLKLDVAGHLGMATSGEIIGTRIFHAAGYNVPGSFLIDVTPGELRVDKKATFKLFGVETRPLTEAMVAGQLALAAHYPDGRIRAVAVPWLAGRVLGAFDMTGTRPGDPNDRIPHQHRRSLRASRLLYTWLSILDPSAINTLDSYVEEGGRRFVRHYLFDFGCAFGSATSHTQGLHEDGEYLVEVGRTLGAFASLGLYRRPFQTKRSEWLQLVGAYPAVAYLPADDFDPDSYRSNRKNPAFVRMTDRDAYWGAKIVTSFSDAQVAALVAMARLPEADAAYLQHALLVRRDILGRRYLLPVAAVENPRLDEGGANICFDDLAIARGYLRADQAVYDVTVGDGHDQVLTRLRRAPPVTGSVACLPIGGAGRGTGYRVIEVRTEIAGRPGKAARIHLRWRDDERRFVFVGLERDE